MILVKTLIIHQTKGFGIVLSGQSSVELELVNNLTSDYDYNARPVASPGAAVIVRMSMALQQIVELVSYKQYFEKSLKII